MINKFWQKDNKILRRYIKEAKRYPALEREQEKSLILKVQQGSRKSLNALVNSHLLFVVKIAYKFRNQGLELEDVISAGNIGLIQAAMRVNPALKNKFITYAIWWIRQSIRYAIFNQSRLIRLASNKEEKLRILFKQTLPMKSIIGGTEFDWENLKGALGKDTEDLKAIVRFMDTPVSIDSRVKKDENISLKEVLASDENTPEESFYEQERKEHIKNATTCLNKRESRVLREYFGLSDMHSLSLSEIGEEQNLSKERIRQIKNKALKKLRSILSEQYAYSMA
ncbi:MAG: RNA polymerase sigma factor RpoD/SigA [Fibrobacteria bacterium]|nr:RNA polymerase sigma factor RpoD/SigA [Fibrobacteria bacterium]